MMAQPARNASADKAGSNSAGVDRRTTSLGTSTDHGHWREQAKPSQHPDSLPHAKAASQAAGATWTGALAAAVASAPVTALPHITDHRCVARDDGAAANIIRGIMLGEFSRPARIFLQYLFERTCTVPAHVARDTAPSSPQHATWRTDGVDGVDRDTRQAGSCHIGMLFDLAQETATLQRLYNEVRWSTKQLWRLRQGLVDAGVLVYYPDVTSTGQGWLGWSPLFADGRHTHRPGWGGARPSRSGTAPSTQQRQPPTADSATAGDAPCAPRPSLVGRNHRSGAVYNLPEMPAVYNLPEDTATPEWQVVDGATTWHSEDLQQVVDASMPTPPAIAWQPPVPSLPATTRALEPDAAGDARTHASRPAHVHTRVDQQTDGRTSVNNKFLIQSSQSVRLLSPDARMAGRGDVPPTSQACTGAPDPDRRAYSIAPVTPVTPPTQPATPAARSARPARSTGVEEMGHATLRRADVAVATADGRAELAPGQHTVVPAAGTLHTTPTAPALDATQRLEEGNAALSADLEAIRQVLRGASDWHVSAQDETLGLTALAERNDVEWLHGEAVTYRMKATSHSMTGFIAWCQTPIAAASWNRFLVGRQARERVTSSRGAGRPAGAHQVTPILTPEQRARMGQQLRRS